MGVRIDIMYAFNGGGGAFALQLSARVSSGDVMLHELVGSMGLIRFGAMGAIGAGFGSGTRTGTLVTGTLVTGTALRFGSGTGAIGSIIFGSGTGFGSGTLATIGATRTGSAIGTGVT